MAYNTKTHAKESVVMPIGIQKKIVAEATANRRSKSSQILYIIEQYYKRSPENELEHENS